MMRVRRSLPAPAWARSYRQAPDIMGDQGRFAREDKPLVEKWLDTRAHVPWTKQRIKANFGNVYALQSIGVGVALLFGIVTLLGPQLKAEIQELDGKRRLEQGLKRTSIMATATREWWANEWRAGRTPWKSTKQFLSRSEPFDWVKEVTGKDPRDIQTFLHVRDTNDVGEGGKSSRSSTWSWRSLFRSKPPEGAGTKPDDDTTASRPEALVPMCGDDPHVRQLMNAGWRTIAVDGADTAIRSLAEQLELGLTDETQQRTTLLYEDIFSSMLWKDWKGKFDYIHDRQGITSLPLDRREDYAFLLKQSLKEDGVIFMEGAYRTGRVPGNKKRGPPFILLEPEIRSLFPERDGYIVKCLNKQDAAITQIQREARILGLIPTELHFTEFPCAIYKQTPPKRDGPMNAATR